MLLNLTILDLAVVKSLNLDFAVGMSVLTGETGAGKSILLTALGLALGDRADSGYIRPDCQRAEINLEFELSDVPDTLRWLQERDLAAEQQCLIRRIIDSKGRSKAYINNHAVTLQCLQELSEQLVEIHGQHAHLRLLQADEQRRLLDAYGKNQGLLDKLNRCYGEWQSTQKALSALIEATRTQQEREELLRYQLDELQQLGIEQLNYAALTEEHGKQANVEQILSSGQSVLNRLIDDEQCVNRQLNASLKELNSITQFAPELDALVNLLTEAQIQIDEAAHELQRFLNGQEADPQRLSELENQLSVLQSLSRKHHVRPDELADLLQRLSAELDNFSHNSERQAELQVQSEQLQTQYRELAAQLSAQRGKQAKKLQKQISALIKELGMPHGDFLVEVREKTSDTPRLNGTDSVQFLVSANVGLPPKPLAKVASGGELSRISLAIQVSTASDKTIPTLIFDEVDSGIGGGVAEIVGQKLRKLSANRQVLCVTHLPQVAAQAHQHLFVEKTSQTDNTTSSVRLLSDEQRVSEVARMLGGVTMTENTLAHAREMLAVGQEQ